MEAFSLFWQKICVSTQHFKKTRSTPGNLPRHIAQETLQYIFLKPLRVPQNITSRATFGPWAASLTPLAMYKQQPKTFKNYCPSSIIVKINQCFTIGPSQIIQALSGFTHSCMQAAN